MYELTILKSELISIYSPPVPVNHMNIKEARNDFEIDVESIGGAFVSSFVRDPRRLTNVLTGLVLPLSFVGTVWTSLAYLWWLFLYSVFDVAFIQDNLFLLAFVFIFIGNLTYFWTLLTGGIIAELRMYKKGHSRTVRQSVPPSQGLPRTSSQHSGKFDQPVGKWH